YLGDAGEVIEENLLSPLSARTDHRTIQAVRLVLAHPPKQRKHACPRTRLLSKTPSQLHTYSLRFSQGHSHVERTWSEAACTPKPPRPPPPASGLPRESQAPVAAAHASTRASAR